VRNKSELAINFTSCTDCENYEDPLCIECQNHEYFAKSESQEEDEDYYLHDGHTRKRWKKSKKGNWSFFPLYDKDYTIEKQLNDMEYKRANWSI
jgi:hypothetical protein